MNATVPSSYIQMFSNYDKAFVDKLRSIRYYTQDRTKNDVNYAIPCVFATPERAFGQIKKQIARKTGKAEQDIVTIPLPIASISRIDQKLDLNRYVRYKFRRQYYAPNDELYIGMWRPAPWDMTYQVDLWARTIGDLDMLTVQLVQWLRADEFYLTVDHEIPMGERIVLTQFMGMAENSQLDHGTEEKRTLRRTFSYVVHGWIYFPRIDTRIIKKIIVDFYDTSNEFDPVFLEQLVVYENELEQTVIPEDEEADVMGRVATTLDVTLIPGDINLGQSYGNFSLPASARIVGMQANILGATPSGDSVELQLEIDGVVDEEKHVIIEEGGRSKSVTFAESQSVTAGQVLSVLAASVGSVVPGSWLEVRVNVELEVTV